MKKNFIFYVLIWAIMLAAFDLVVFLVRPVIPGYVIEYDARFWVAWIAVHVAFIGNLICSFKAFRSENLKKMFYSLPLITVSWTALIAMTVASGVLMSIPNLPAWIAAIVCILILAFYAIAVIKSFWAADAVEKIDEKVKEQTSFIKNLSATTEGLIARAKSEQVKAECKKVYEAVRYSDPISSLNLSVEEAKIKVKMDEFTYAVNDDDINRAKETAESLIILVDDRSQKKKTNSNQ